MAQTHELRKFGITTGSVLVGLSVVLFLFHRGSGPYFFVVGGGMLISGAFAPSLLKPIHRISRWLVGKFNQALTFILFAVFFYTIFSLWGLTLRVFGRTSLNLAFDRASRSYWRPRKNEEKRRKDYERQY